jgi:hypothetical protein
MSIEPVLADAPLPIAAFSELVVLDALITVDFSTLEPLILIEPVLAEAFSPIAAFNELVVLRSVDKRRFFDLGAFGQNAAGGNGHHNESNGGVCGFHGVILVVMFKWWCFSTASVYRFRPGRLVILSRQSCDLFTSQVEALPAA